MYERMNIWKQIKEHENKTRLLTTGETRWWPNTVENNIRFIFKLGFNYKAIT